MRSVTFAVSGMHCDGCALSVEQALRVAPGVRAARVTFADGWAAIEFDDAAASETDLIAAIRAAGFDAAVLRDA